MAANRIRAFLDTNVLLAALRGEEGAKRLLSFGGNGRATFVVSPVVLQELLLSAAAAGPGADLDEVTRHLEVLPSDMPSDPDSLARLRHPNGGRFHVNDLLIAGSARDGECDVLVTDDHDLTELAPRVDLATATPAELLDRLGEPDRTGEPSGAAG